MTDKEIQKKEIKKYLVISILFVISIAIIGLSLSYAYFTVNFKNPDEEDENPITVPSNTAANLNVTSTIDEIEAINAENLVLIDENEIDLKAKHLRFAVTNEQESTIGATYTIDFVEMQISKNLLSKYFKWKIVITHDDETSQTIVPGNFHDPNCSPSVNGAINGGENGECHYELTKKTAPECQDEEECPPETGIFKPSEEEMMVHVEDKYIQKTTENLPKSSLTLATIENLGINHTDTIDFYIWLENDNIDQLYLTNGLFSGKLSITAVPYKAN